MKFKVTVETRSMLGLVVPTTSTVEVEAKNKEEAKEEALKSLYLSGPIARSFVTKITVVEVKT